MRIVVFGLSVSSAWGNGHATLWRGLCRALGELGHVVEFFERDVPYYAAHRDLLQWPGLELRLYDDWDGVVGKAQRAVASADVAMVTSFCPDGRAACDLVLNAIGPRRVFYDLDTPVTLDRLNRGRAVEYLPDYGLSDFDLVLSSTGGTALDALQQRLGARVVAPLYGAVDPAVHRPLPNRPSLRADLSYLGTYAEDRQVALQRLFLGPATVAPTRRFLIGGVSYPADFSWRPNIYFRHHVTPADHPSFYGSSRCTLNVTRGPMRSMGHCPSARLFEAAACETPVVSDWWLGLDEFFEPGSEILVARNPDDVMTAMDLGDEVLAGIGRAARARVLDCHTADHRAKELVALVEHTDAHAWGAPRAAAHQLYARIAV